MDSYDKKIERIESTHVIAARELLRGFKGELGASYLQRNLRIGYNLSLNVLERLESEGVISRLECGYRFKVVK